MIKYYEGAAAFIAMRWEQAKHPEAMGTVLVMASDIALLFKTYNERFSYDKFYAACGLPVPQHLVGA